MIRDDAYLEKYDEEKNQHRYYMLSVQPTLFGGWSLVRSWGRIGRSRRTRADLYQTRAAARSGLRSKNEGTALKLEEIMFPLLTLQAQVREVFQLPEPPESSIGAGLKKEKHTHE
jgi:predicted DNA-binding WGR domain protein